MNGTTSGPDRPYDDTLAAMQSEMLAIDEDFASDWIGTMRRLVSEKLDHNEFTRQRMAALHLWERRRKAAQDRLRYKYGGTGRRKPELVARDVRAQLAKVREALDAARERTAETGAHRDGPERERPVSPVPRARINARARVTPVRENFAEASKVEHSKSTRARGAHTTPGQELQVQVRALDTLNPSLLQMVADCTGLDDELATASDAEVMHACMVHSRIDEAAAQEYVDILNGVDIVNRTILPTS